MALLDQGTVRNRLLTALPPEMFVALQPHMTMVQLPLKHVLVAPHMPTDMVCVIEIGLGSMVASTSDQEQVEVGHIGPEGVSGVHVFLGTRESANETFMQVAGYGISIPVDVILEHTSADPDLHQLFLRYAYTCDIQLAQSALANARYNMGERLARWLLMSRNVASMLSCVGTRTRLVAGTALKKPKASSNVSAI